jgi:hypothetical protein
MDDSITVETDLFEHGEVGPHFINPCCFGEDFAAWLKRELTPLVAPGFILSRLMQEDYGWGFRAHHDEDPFWIALGFVGDGPQETPGRWVVSVTYDPGLDLIKRIFHRPDAHAFAVLRDRVWQVIRTSSGITVLESQA